MPVLPIGSEVSRVASRGMLLQLVRPISIILDGTTGVGKTQIISDIADRIYSKVVSVKGTLLCRGDLGGLPRDVDYNGFHETQFSLHEALVSIRRLEKHYYDIATSDGFCDGSIKMDNDGNIMLKDTNGKIETYKRDKIQGILDGPAANFQFGSELPLDIKLKLIAKNPITGKQEITPVILFIDEINRGEEGVMTELMNIVQERTVRSYKLPWWCFIIGAQNPPTDDDSYTVQEMDKAQLDRFLILQVNSSIVSWTEYMSKKTDLDPKYYLAIASNDKLFDPVGKEETKNIVLTMNPRPRSHEVCSAIYSYAKSFNHYFTKDENDEIDDDITTLISGKIGDSTAKVVMSIIKNLENFILPEQVLTGDSDKLDEYILEKIKGQSTIVSVSTYHAVFEYFMLIAENLFKTESTNVKSKNKINQFVQYISVLPVSTQTIFIRNSASRKILGITNDGMEVERPVILWLGSKNKSFTPDLVARIQAYKKDMISI